MSEKEKVELIEPPKKRLCDAIVLLGPTLVALINANPQNPQVRASVMARCCKSLPDEAKTAKEVLDWVEYNVEASKLTPKTKTATVALEIECEVSETDIGQCRYSCRRDGLSIVAISNPELLRIAGECDSVSELMSAIDDFVAEGVWDDPSWGDEHDYDYEHHESTDTEDSNWNYNRTRERDRVLAALRLLSPEEHDRITE